MSAPRNNSLRLGSIALDVTHEFIGERHPYFRQFREETELYERLAISTRREYCFASRRRLNSRKSLTPSSLDAPMNNYVLHGITIFIAEWFLVYIAQGQYFKGCLFAGSFVLLGYLMVQGMVSTESIESHPLDGTDSIPQSQSVESLQPSEQTSSAGDSLRDEQGHIRQEFQSFLAKDYRQNASGFQPQFSNLPVGDNASIMSNVSRFQEQFASKQVESPEEEYDLFLDARDLDYAIEHGISSLKH
ncbi:hypothetical protein BZG36_05101 [Bifiguratus adelaidae]|uniref:Uncharacterized protein n=1 Tax=Bifiguratus adelaidae TaxID=1938954 RepID=A0A261XU81_9FUNG|nr:hypothetical protein BZG36_05101 [Bifiguratus adelaidae]